jgi:SAM-dependent methyltransferase
MDVSCYCESCGRVTTHELKPLTIRPEDTEYKESVCSVCHLRHCHPMPSTDQLNAYYGYTIPSGDGMRNPIRKVWTRMHDARMLRYIERHAPSGTFLDIGAGRGRFIRVAQGTGRWNLIATEYSDEAIERLRGLGVDARQGNFDEVGIEPESVDVIWMSHVIEHLPDTSRFFAFARQVLRPDGILTMLTPSSQSLRSRLALTDWHLINPPGHLWSFTPRTFANLVRNNGFDILELHQLHLISEVAVVAKKTNR